MVREMHNGIASAFTITAKHRLGFVPILITQDNGSSEIQVNIRKLKGTN